MPIIYSLYISMALFIFSPGMVCASLVHEESVTLEDLVKEADEIYLAEKDVPSCTVQKIKIHPDIKKYPPFENTVFHFKIIQVLYGTKGVKGGKIDVEDAYADMSLELHRKYYLEGTLKSPIYRFYHVKLDFNKEKKIILFLQHKKDKLFRLITMGSYESPEKKRTIIQLIRKKGKQAREDI